MVVLTHTAIQNAIDAAYNAGGGTVDLDAGTGVMDAKLVLPTGVRLRGQGHTATILKAGVSMSAVVETADFDNQTGQDLWFVDTEGVHTGFGLESLMLDGDDKAVRGVNWFGKRFILDNVFAQNCTEHLYYFECGSKGGQHDWRDMPESSIGTIWGRNAGSDGLVYNGPHDGYFKAIFIAQMTNGDGHGVVINQPVDGGLIHAYASARDGIRINTANCRFDILRGETCQENGVNIIGNDNYFGLVEGAHYNRDLAAKNGVILNGNRNLINSVHVRHTVDNAASTRGLTNTGDKNQVGLALLHMTANYGASAILDNGTNFSIGHSIKVGNW